MLRYKADRLTLVYMLITTLLLPLQWSLSSFSWPLFLLGCFMAVSVTVMSHNHNHVRMWRSRTLNVLTDYWLTLFYGFPAFAWIPTHNMNHHKFVNREGDQTLTYRFTHRNNLLTLITYPAVSAYYQQSSIRNFLFRQWAINRRRFMLCLSQYLVLALFVGTALWLDWRKALLFIVIPHQIGLFTVLVFNYLQHVGANPHSEVDHSRNIVGPWMNRLLFNNGFHTVHHDEPGLHWSELPEAHAKVAHRIHPSLNEPSFWWLVLRTYILAPVFPKLRRPSLYQAPEQNERPAAAKHLPSEMVQSLPAE